jgi:hypothetical protein
MIARTEECTPRLYSPYLCRLHTPHSRRSAAALPQQLFQLLPPAPRCPFLPSPPPAPAPLKVVGSDVCRHCPHDLLPARIPPHQPRVDGLHRHKVRGGGQAIIHAAALGVDRELQEGGREGRGSRQGGGSDRKGSEAGPTCLPACPLLPQPVQQQPVHTSRHPLPTRLTR